MAKDYCTIVPRFVCRMVEMEQTPCESHFYLLAVVGPRNLSIVCDLLNQTDLDQDFCDLYTDLSFEGRFSTFLAHFCLVSTWYE